MKAPGGLDTLGCVLPSPSVANTVKEFGSPQIKRWVDGGTVTTACTLHFCEPGGIPAVDDAQSLAGQIPMYPVCTTCM